MNDKPKTIRHHISGMMQWWAFYMIVFFLTFPLWAPALVWTLKTVLEGLNNFGSGY
jgi:hypothetical protein